MTKPYTFANRQNLLLLAGLFGLLAMACDAYVKVQGKVLDEQGRPIEGATITAYQGGHKLEQQTSSKDGSFDIFEGVSPWGTSKIKVVVEKEGFVTREEEFNTRELPMNPNVDPNIPHERVFILLRQTE